MNNKKNNILMVLFDVIDWNEIKLIQQYIIQNNNHLIAICSDELFEKLLGRNAITKDSNRLDLIKSNFFKKFQRIKMLFTI